MTGIPSWYSTSPSVLSPTGVAAADKTVLYWDATTHTLRGSADLLFNATAKTLTLGSGGQLWVYNTYTDAGNYERGVFKWNANTLVIATENGAPGVQRGINMDCSVYTFYVGGAQKWLLDPSGAFRPYADAAVDIGSAANRVRTGYFGGADASQGIIIKAGAAQSANLQEWQNSSGTPLSTITSDGRLGIGTGSPVAKLHLEGAYAAVATNNGNARFLMNVDVNNNPSIELHRGKAGFNQATALFMDWAWANDADYNFRWIMTQADILKLTGSGSCRFDAGITASLHSEAILSLDGTGVVGKRLYVVADSSNGYVGIGTGNSPTARLHVKGFNDAVQLKVQANSAQTANLQEWQNSGGTPLAYVSKDGFVFLPDGAVGTPSLAFGSNTDTGLYYTTDAINFSINNSKQCFVDGTSVQVLVDQVFVGAGSGLPFGSTYGEEIAWTQASAVQNTLYAVSSASLLAGPLNLVTHSNGVLTVTKAGKYLAHWTLTCECSVAAQHIRAGFMVSSAGVVPGRHHEEVHSPNQELNMSGTAILDLAASATVQLCIGTIDAGTPTITVDTLNITLTQIGG